MRSFLQATADAPPWVPSRDAGLIERHHFEACIRDWRKEQHQAHIDFFAQEVDFIRGEWSKAKEPLTPEP